jgi:calmodulin
VLQNYLQSVGIVIERKEIKNKLDENGQKDKDEFTFEELYNLFSSLDSITNEDIINAFKVFDKNGKINKEELKYVMTNLGDKITEKEAEKLLSNFQVDEQGNLDYKEFLSKYGIDV